MPFLCVSPPLASVWLYPHTCCVSVVSRVTLCGPCNPRERGVTFSYPASIGHVQWRTSHWCVCILVTRGQEDTGREQSNPKSMHGGSGSFSMKKRFWPDTFQLSVPSTCIYCAHTRVLFFHMYVFFCTLPNITQPTQVYPCMHVSLSQSKSSPSAFQLDHPSLGALDNRCYFLSLEVAFHRPAIYI